MAVRRFRDLKIKYTRDNGLDRLVVQRNYVNVSNGTARTPITPLLLARRINEPWVLEPRDVVARYVESCFIVDDKESIFKSIIPYHPNDPTIVDHAKELKEYPGVINSTYYGENRTYK